MKAKLLANAHAQGRRHDIVAQMRSNESAFCQAMVATGMLTQAQMERAAERYQLGRSRQGGVVFWQIDERQVLREGKVMFYGADCHRDHQRHPSWASYLLKRQGLLPEDREPQRCLFGLHLLKTRSPPPIVVVEAEKTAVIMSEVFTSYIWMASGGLTMLSVDKLLPLNGHKVILMPDTDPEGQAWKLWHNIGMMASSRMTPPVVTSRLLEERATEGQKLRKIDLVDYCFEK